MGSFLTPIGCKKTTFDRSAIGFFSFSRWVRLVKMTFSRPTHPTCKLRGLAFKERLICV
jgi:hypothetical protein